MAKIMAKTRRTKLKKVNSIPPKSAQVCDTCKHWYKHHGTCASPGGHCGSGMYFPIYKKI